MTEYSTKFLTQKLGLKDNSIIILLNQPENYGRLLHPFPANCSFYDSIVKNANFIQLFTTSKEELKNIFPELKKALVQDGSLWISWPKGSSKKPTDLNENIIREIGLENGLVDVKVVAVDEIWSGLKFVYRVKDRNSPLSE